MDGSQEPDFRIGDWWVRPQLRSLEKGETAVKVEARSMRVLVCLARQARQVVTKQRIIEEVWGDAFVGDEVISHCVWELRKVLGDDAREPRFIQTIPRKGYRLLLPISRPSVAGEPQVGTRVGPYEIAEKLGNGAMGVVYKAVDRRLQRTVALKFLAPELTRDPTARRRFEREARLAAALDHPNLATVHDVCDTAEDRQYIVTAFYGGGSLEDRLAGGPIPVPEAVDIALQVTRGLEEAHRHDIIHRDVKPANVLLTETGIAKLVDFGIAKLTSGTRLTQTGSSLGTPAYKSPEQSRGEPVDHRSDIWSLGVLLYEMVSGRKPFAGEYEHAVVRSILEDEPEPLTDPGGRPVPASLQEVVRRATTKRPADRYQSAAELAEDLAHCAKGGVGVRRSAPMGRRLAARRVVWPTLLAILVGVVAAYLLVRDNAGRGQLDGEVARRVDQGEHYERRGDDVESLDGAERAYRAALALALAPEQPEVQARLALLLMRRYPQIDSPAPEILEEIRGLVGAAFAGDPESSLVWLARSRLSLLEDDLEGAEKEARRAIVLDSEDGRGPAFLGLALWDQGRQDEALEWIRRGTELVHGHVRARLILARKLWLRGEVDAAAAEYKKITDEYAHDHPTALNNLGILYLLSNRNLDALGIFRQLYDKKKDYRFANNIGTALFNLGRWDEAIEAFREASELKPDYVNAPIGLGDTYWMKGDDEAAGHWFEKALGIYDRMMEEGSPAPIQIGQRAVCLAKLERFPEAVEEIERALRIQPGRGDLLFNAAQIEALAGDRDELYRATRQAVAAGYSREDFLNDPCFRDHREDPDFLAALESR